MDDSKKTVVLIAGAGNAARLAAEAVRKLGEAFEQFDAVVIDEDNQLTGIEFKTALKELEASPYYRPRRNKSDRKRNKRNRWR